MDTQLLNIPIAVAMIAMTKLLLDHFSKERDKDRVQLENHLSQSILVQKDTAVILSKLNDKLDRLL